MANQAREGKAKTWLPRGILISGHGSFQGDLYLTLEQQLLLPSAPLAPPSSCSFLQTIPYYTVGFMSTPQVLPNDLSFYAGLLSASTLITKPSVVSAGLENEVSPCAARSGLAPTLYPRLALAKAHSGRRHHRPLAFVL